MVKAITEPVATAVTRTKLDQAAEAAQAAHVVNLANRGQMVEVMDTHAAAASAAVAAEAAHRMAAAGEDQVLLESCGAAEEHTLVLIPAINKH